MNFITLSANARVRKVKNRSPRFEQLMLDACTANHSLKNRTQNLQVEVGFTGKQHHNWLSALSR